LSTEDIERSQRFEHIIPCLVIIPHNQRLCGAMRF
jgi:hypothetical protein